MVKPRKGPEEKKQRKKLTKWQIILPVVLVGAGTGGALGINYLIAGPPPLERCMPDENMGVDAKMEFHIHSYITATLDGQPFEVPANIGIKDDCVRPLHTGEADGTIHITYVKPVKFTLSVFIKLWGLNLDQYNVKIFVKNPDDAEFGEYTEHINQLVFTNEMRIKLELTSR